MQTDLILAMINDIRGSSQLAPLVALVATGDQSTLTNIFQDYTGTVDPTNYMVVVNGSTIQIHGQVTAILESVHTDNLRFLLRINGVLGTTTKLRRNIRVNPDSSETHSYEIDLPALLIELEIGV